MTTSPGSAPTAARDARNGPHGLRLFTLGGVPVYLDPNWLFMAGLVFFVNATSLGRSVPGTTGYVVAALYALTLLVSVLLHEAAHAVAARAFGYPVLRVVANMWGGHTLFDPGANPAPLRSAAIAVVGPITNLLIGGAAWLALPTIESDLVWYVLWGVAFLNLALGVLNLLPGLPLDGGQVVAAVIERVTGSRATSLIVAGWLGRLVAVGLVAYFLLVPFLNGGRPDLWDVAFVAFIGSMLWTRAGEAIAGARYQRRADGLSVAALRRAAHPAGAQEIIADVAARVRGIDPLPEVVIVDGGGRPVGLLDFSGLGNAPGETPADLDRLPASAFLVVQPDGWVMDVEGVPTVHEVVERLQQINSPVVVLRDRTGPDQGAGTAYWLVRAQDLAVALEGAS